MYVITSLNSTFNEIQTYGEEKYMVPFQKIYSIKWISINEIILLKVFLTGMNETHQDTFINIFIDGILYNYDFI